MYHIICEKCLKPLSYKERWDSFYCPQCNDCKIEECSDIDFYYCDCRPNKPTTTQFFVVDS
jgi:hypothetical protein